MAKTVVAVTIHVSSDGKSEPDIETVVEFDRDQSFRDRQRLLNGLKESVGAKLDAILGKA